MSPSQEPRFSDLLREQKQEILADWVRIVCSLPKARRLERPALVDHVPELLERLADDLAAGAPSHLASGLAEQHAAERLDEGFDLHEVVTEYGVLRDCIVRRWAPGSNVNDLCTANQAIDRAIAASIERYTKLRDRTLKALDELSTAALEAPTLDDFLRSILRVLLQTTAAVDKATLLLREGERLVVRATVGLEPEISPGFSVAIGEGIAGTIAKTRRPLSVRSASTDPLTLDPTLISKGVKGVYGVPLLDGDDVIGVAYMGSVTAYEFSEQDQRLLQALAHRSISAIFQHRLRAAADRRQQFETIVENHPDLMYLLDRELRFTWVNAAMLSFWGKRRDEVLGKTLAELGYPPHLLELHRHEMGEVLRGKTIKGENADRQPSGERIWEYVLAPVLGADGAPHAIAGINRDITDRRRVLDGEQTARREAERALAVVDALLSSSLIGFGFIDRELRYLRINDALAAINGRPAQEHLGRTVHEMIGELGGPLEQVLRRVIETGKPVANLELNVAPPSTPNQTRSFLANYFPVRTPGREVLGVGAAVVEITDRTRARDALHDAVKAREEILAVVSHDLKNPLAAIHMAASLLSRKPSPDARVRKQVETIQRSASRMAHLIGDLQDMASVQAGRLAVDRKAEDPLALLSEAIETHEPAATEKGLRLVLDCELGGRQVLCDRERLLQVFGNLLGNSIKFCRTGDVITVEGRVEDNAARFSVSDTGPGIPGDELQHVFEPYWSAQRHAKKGTGLGLYITKGIVEAQGGRIGVESQPGRATTFTFTVPLSDR